VLRFSARMLGLLLRAILSKLPRLPPSGQCQPKRSDAQTGLEKLQWLVEMSFLELRTVMCLSRARQNARVMSSTP
jgi:hypothetical protein